MPLADPDMAAAERPQPGDRPQQRALARARRPGDQDGAAGTGGQLDFLAQRPTIGKIEVERVDLDAGSLPFDRDRLWCATLGGDLVHPGAEAAQPFDDGLVFGDLGVAGYDEGERILDPAKGRGDLHQPTKLDLLGEITRRRDQKGKYRRHLLITIGEPAQFLATNDDVPPIRDDMSKPL